MRDCYILFMNTAVVTLCGCRALVYNQATPLCVSTGSCGVALELSTKFCESSRNIQRSLLLGPFPC